MRTALAVAPALPASRRRARADPGSRPRAPPRRRQQVHAAGQLAEFLLGLGVARSVLSRSPRVAVADAVASASMKENRRVVGEPAASSVRPSLATSAQNAPADRAGQLAAELHQPPVGELRLHQRAGPGGRAPRARPLRGRSQRHRPADRAAPARLRPPPRRASTSGILPLDGPGRTSSGAKTESAWPRLSLRRIEWLPMGKGACWMVIAAVLALVAAGVVLTACGDDSFTGDRGHRDELQHLGRRGRQEEADRLYGGGDPGRVGRRDRRPGDAAGGIRRVPPSQRCAAPASPRTWPTRWATRSMQQKAVNEALCGELVIRAATRSRARPRMTSASSWTSTCSVRLRLQHPPRRRSLPALPAARHQVREGAVHRHRRAGGRLG